MGEIISCTYPGMKFVILLTVCDMIMLRLFGQDHILSLFLIHLAIDSIVCLCAPLSGPRLPKTKENTNF